MNKIYLSSPSMGKNEHKYVSDVFKTNWIAPVGPYLEKFEQNISNQVGVNNVVALQSGTSAIHLALRILDIGKDDIVLCQSSTFIGSASPIIYQNATPIFVDSERDTWNICPNVLEEAIIDGINKGNKPKAIIIVHLYGMPAKMDEIINISKKYEIPIIEDAAESLGSHIDNKQCGSFGRFGIFSFNGNKIITTSGGGALVSHNKNDTNKAKFLATQAKEKDLHYEHNTYGYNYRLSNVLAAIGCGQMEVLNQRIKQKRNIFDHYKSSFSSIKFQNEPNGYFSNRWLTCGLLKNKKQRDNLITTLSKYNIESRPLWKPMHMQPLFKTSKYYGSNISEDLFNRGICLPSDVNMTEKDLNRIDKILINFFKI